jgi:FMN-dependent NADH-azoreductase
MTTLLKVQSSLFSKQGQSSALTDLFAEQWLKQNPGGQIVTRNLASEPVPHLDQQRFGALTTPEDQRSEQQQLIVAYSDTLINEIKNAEMLVLGVPMYNFSVPSVLRAYFDHIARAGVTFRYTAKGPEGLLTGKKAIVFITRGGYYGDDHSQSEYIRQFLGFLGITDVQIVHAEGLGISEEAKFKGLSEAREKIPALLAA